MSLGYGLGMELRPVTRLSVSDAAYAQLRDEILSGRLAPGDAVPSERTLTELLGVNRQAVREALKRLDQAGLIEITHGGATKVCDYRTSAGLDLLADLLLHGGGVDVVVARSVMEMRACIGPDAARLCADRVVPATVAAMERCTTAMRSALGEGDDLRLAALDWELWALIIDGADNIAYRLAFNSLRAAAEPLNELLLPLRSAELRDVATRDAMVAAIAGHDSTAAEAAARHLLRAGSAAISLALAGDTPAAAPAPSTGRPRSARSATKGARA